MKQRRKMLMEGSMHEKFASGCTNGDETRKAYKHKVLKSSDESNIHIAVGDGNEGQDCCLLHDDSIRSEETMKSNEQYSEKGNNDFGEGDVDNNDKTDKRFQELNVLALSIEERILKA
ncbi:hypothetical protein AtNW77_Chr1g0046971 [Arabidopsis thaliana]|uniref:Plant mobile domain protein n=2 Tax=Arabidopsis TaxID=3701 RepID=F4HWT1_ARATH|nr:plant mobile domain protein [Arabidopsis thaliana]AEE32255.1 plant mobile domain protein [Arabidopsis thaliana]KAG7656806.1 hypothetical protein ISN44_As01g039060 [Arabidopsis suecica]|eukprot:NP_683408.1 plant mobile domain protein [Arabidopsis thaliana]